MFEPIELPLHLPIGAPFPVSVVDAEPSLSRYTIRVRLAAGDWQRADSLELFNLTADVRHPGGVSGHDAVEIDLRLADALVSGVVEAVAGMEPRDGVAELAELDAGSPILSTESWFATTVTEAVRLPDDLAGTGTLREGFTTTWNDSDELASRSPEVTEVVEAPVDPATEPWPPLLDAVREYLDGNDVGFERHAGANMVSAHVAGEHGDWTLWLHTREDARQIVAYSIPSIDIADDRVDQVAEMATRLNSKMFNAAFEVDLDTGGFRCRTSLVLNDVLIDDSLIAGLIQPNLMAIDAALPALASVLGGVQPVDAVRMYPPVT